MIENICNFGDIVQKFQVVVTLAAVSIAIVVIAAAVLAVIAVTVVIAVIVVIAAVVLVAIAVIVVIAAAVLVVTMKMILTQILALVQWQKKWRLHLQIQLLNEIYDINLCIIIDVKNTYKNNISFHVQYLRKRYSNVLI